jgi:hypothetical protein
MQGVLACIDANGMNDCSGCLMGHSDVLLVLLAPGHPLSGSGREHGRSIPFASVRGGAAIQSLSERSGHSAAAITKPIYEYAP